MNYVYHMKPFEMIGSIIHPISQLHVVNRRICSEKWSRVHGAETYSEELVPYLNSPHMDLVHCVAIDPRLIFKALEETGNEPCLVCEWYKIPIDSIKGSFVLWHADRISEAHPRGEFVPMTSQDYQSLTKVSQSNLDYFRELKNEKSHKNVFKYTPKVLIKDSIDIEQASVLNWSDCKLT